MRSPLVLMGSPLLQFLSQPSPLQLLFLSLPFPISTSLSVFLFPLLVNSLVKGDDRCEAGLGLYQQTALSGHWPFLLPPVPPGPETELAPFCQA